MANTESTPQVTVVCTRGACPEQGVNQSVDAGVLLAGGAVLAAYAAYNCTHCGFPMVLVN